MNNDSKRISLKISMGSVTSNPLSDKDIFYKENKRLYKIIIIFIIVDLFLNELIIFNECNYFSAFFDDDKKPSLGLLILYSIISIIFFDSLLIMLYLKKTILSIIARFTYLSIGIFYYIFIILQQLINFSHKDFYMNPFDIIFFIISALTIIPRILGFLYMKIYERTITKIDVANRAEEHENFIEKVVGNFDRSTMKNEKEKELEKELNQNVGAEDEEIIFTMENNKIITCKNDNKTKPPEGNEKEESADLN